MKFTAFLKKLAFWYFSTIYIVITVILNVVKNPLTSLRSIRNKSRDSSGFALRMTRKFQDLPRKKQRFLAGVMVLTTLFIGTGIYLIWPNIFKKDVQAA